MARLYATYKDGDQTKFVPLAVTLDADGLGVLKVDTELSVDSLSLNIDNLKIASTDGTVGNAKYIKVDADGTVHVTGTIGGALGVPYHYNGTANLLKATVTFAGTTKHIQIENMDSAKDIYISFDSGTNWRTIQPGYTVDLDCAVTGLDIKAEADGINYEILTTE